MLINDIVDYCDKMYCKKPIHCAECIEGNCEQNCKNCLDDLHYHRNQMRDDYSCIWLLYYYVCRYSYKYCSEIIYALETIDSNNYGKFNILSLGCGGAADLMAFDFMFNDKVNAYIGIDINTCWDNIHDEIIRKFTRANFFTGIDVLSYVHSNTFAGYNVLIIEYLISFFFSQIGQKRMDKWYDDLVENVISQKNCSSPMLIIINDVDSLYTGRDTYQKLINKLHHQGFTVKYRKMNFLENSYFTGAQTYNSNRNFFNIDYEFQQKYCAPIPCTSAQMIIEVM